jgi:hypothetical protein
MKDLKSGNGSPVSIRVCVRDIRRWNCGPVTGFLLRKFLRFISFHEVRGPENMLEVLRSTPLQFIIYISTVKRYVAELG